MFFSQFKELYCPYVEKTVTLLSSIIKEYPHKDIKEAACKCFLNLIIAVKTENKGLAIHLAKYFIATFI